MSLMLTIMVFFISSIMVLFAVQAGELLLSVSMIGVVLSGLYVGLVMSSKLYSYTAIFFLFRLVMAVLAAYIYINRDIVVTEGQFSFSTFSDSNLQTAIQAFVATLMVILVEWVLQLRRNSNMLNRSSHDLVILLLGRLKLGQPVLAILLIGSFVMAVIFFLTNTTVLEIPYPFQAGTQWANASFFKLPTLMATVCLFGCYVNHIVKRRRTPLLQWARINFMLTLLLMLFLIGSRGFFTFLWMFAGLFEIYFASKKKGSIVWGGIFLFLSWLAFLAWPVLRWYLALAPLDMALEMAWQNALALGADTSHTSIESSILWVGDFPMIGALLFHMLYVIQLIQDGASLGGSTFINLVPQALPGMLDGILWERPLNNNYLLQSSYISMGGFLDVANAYWNGGMVVMLSYVAVVSGFLIGFDRYLIRNETGGLYKVVYWLSLPLLLIQMGYGIQGFARVIELLLLMILIDQMMKRKKHSHGIASSAGHV